MLKSGLIVFVATLFITTGYESSAKEQRTLEQALVDAAREVNKQLPMALHEDSTIDKVTAYQRTMEYTVTLHNRDNEPFLYKPFKAFMEKYLTNKLCSDKGTRSMMDYGVNCKYVYYSESGKKLLTLNFDRNRCSK
jgi:hypothetical protein